MLKWVPDVCILWRVCVRLRMVSVVVVSIELQSDLLLYFASAQRCLQALVSGGCGPGNKTRRRNAESRALPCRFYHEILRFFS